MTEFATEQESVVNTKKIGAFFNKVGGGLASVFSKEQTAEEGQGTDPEQSVGSGSPGDVP